MFLSSPTKQENPQDSRRSVRIADNINHEYRQKFEAIENSIKDYRDGKQEIFTPEQLLQILDKKVSRIRLSLYSHLFPQQLGRTSSGQRSLRTTFH